MEKPFLLHRIRRGHVYHTVAPTGRWTGIYTGVEYLKALELGYKLKIIDGIVLEAKKHIPVIRINFIRYEN